MRIINEKNYGLEILRMILCFWVLCFHCLKESNNNIILSFKRKMFHVPSFFFISFYFLFPVIKSRNINKMRQRLIRLSISYIFWPLITFSFNNILFLLKIKSRYKRFLLLKELIMQWIFGRKFYVQFWFLFNLLFFTIMFFIQIFILKINNFLIFTQIIAITSYFLQYSKYNYIFFDNYSNCISHSIGHFVESYPIASSAFTLSELNVLTRLENITRSQNIIILYCLIAIFFIFKYDIFMDIENYGHTYNYNGIDKNIFSLIIFIGFYLIPFNKCNSDKLKIIIKLITNYTQGIYCIHPIVSYYLTKFLSVKHTVFGCTLIYIFSYFISFLGAKLSGNKKIRYLFL